MKTRRLRMGAAMLALGLVAAACGDDSGSTGTPGNGGTQAPTTTAEPQSGGELTFAVYGETPGLDPVVANGSGTTGGHEMSAVYDTLVRWNPVEQEYQPRLAESLEPNDDFTVWTLKLRPGITFTDGTPLDGDAVKFNVERHVEHRSRAAGLVARIAEITVVDDTTVTFTLTSGWSGFPYVLAYTPGMIGSPTAIGACGDASPRECDYNTNPVGAGPFQIVSFLPREAITLSKNADYWNGEPHLDTLKFVFIDTGGPRTYAALQTGSVQSAFLRQPEQIKAAQDELQGHLALNWLGGMLLINNGLQVNCSGGAPEPVCTGKPDGPTATTPITADKRIRQAVAYATNVDTINERLWNGNGFASTDFFHESSRFYAGREGTQYDPAKARELIEEVKAEGDWDGSIRIFCHNGNPAWAVAVGTLLEAAGFTVNPKDDQDVAGLINDIQIRKDFDISCWGFNVYEDDPFINLNQNLHSQSAGNWIGYANPEVDRLLEAAVAARDDEARKEAYDGIAEIWNEDVPSVIFEATGEMVAWRNDVHGIEVTVANNALFDKAWIG